MCGSVPGLVSGSFWLCDSRNESTQKTQATVVIACNDLRGNAETVVALNSD